MANKPTKPVHGGVYASAESRVPNGRSAMQPGQSGRLSPGNPGGLDDDDVDSWGIGSITVVDIEKILDGDSPTDEMPIIDDDDKTFV